MTLEGLFKDISLPVELDRSRISQMSSGEYEHQQLSEEAKKRLDLLIQVLEHPNLASEISKKHVTLAMIKPAWYNQKGVGDEEAAAKIEKEIKKPLRTVVSIAIRFSRSDVEVFYAGQKELLLSQTRPGAVKNKWEEHLDYMTSGATTALLLYSPKGDAITEWRKQIGHWNVEGKRDKRTIRGRWARDNITSIVHGSDSPEAVVREIGVLRDHLARLASRN